MGIILQTWNKIQTLWIEHECKIYKVWKMVIEHNTLGISYSSQRIYLGSSIQFPVAQQLRVIFRSSIDGRDLWENWKPEAGDHGRGCGSDVRQNLQLSVQFLGVKFSQSCCWMIKDYKKREKKRKEDITQLFSLCLQRQRTYAFSQ